MDYDFALCCVVLCISHRLQVGAGVIDSQAIKLLYFT